MKQNCTLNGSKYLQSSKENLLFLKSNLAIFGIIKYKRGYAEFPNIPQLIAKNTLPFGQIMYENLSDLIQGRTRSSRCTSFETYSTQLYRTYAYVYSCCSYSCDYDFSLCTNLKILQLICAMKYVALKQKDLLTDFNLLSHFSSTLQKVYLLL